MVALSRTDAEGQGLVADDGHQFAHTSCSLALVALAGTSPSASASHLCLRLAVRVVQRTGDPWMLAQHAVFDDDGAMHGIDAGGLEPGGPRRFGHQERVRDRTAGWDRPRVSSCCGLARMVEASIA